MISNQAHNNYRPEIDGLRALAILSVILYHAELKSFNIAEGGYLGVDIFFVISGYLITRIILSEVHTTEGFSFKRFYIRRLRRIAPMLILVSAFSLALGWIYLQPTAFENLSISALFALFSFSNIHFYFNQSAYGAVEALRLPLLHTWSLSVEEQFYGFFPLVAFFLLRRGRHWFWLGLSAAVVMSLSWSVFSVGSNSDFAFFFPFTRFWEMMIGSVLAGLEVFSGGRRGLLKPRTSVSIISMSLLLVCLLTFGAETTHPGLATLMPVLATAMWIASTDMSGLCGRLFGVKSMVGIGLISYSAYLWHYPFFAFARVGGEPSDPTKIVIIFGTLALSFLTYRLVEQPFRNAAHFGTRTVVAIVCSSALIVCGFSLLTISNDGFQHRVMSADGFELFVEDNEFLRKESWNLVKERKSEGNLFRDAETRVMIVGNSHGKDLYNALTINNPNQAQFDLLLHQTQLEFFGNNGKSANKKR